MAASQKDKNVTTDNKFACVTLARAVRERGMKSEGTRLTNRKGMPTELKSDVLNKLESVLCYNSSDSQLFVRYQTKNNENDTMFSTQHQGCTMHSITNKC